MGVSLSLVEDLFILTTLDYHIAHSRHTERGGGQKGETPHSVHTQLVELGDSTLVKMFSSAVYDAS